jgi:hypothetical protein
MKGIEEVNSRHPEWLIEVKDAISSGEAKNSDFGWLLKTISGTTVSSKEDNFKAVGCWLQVLLKTLPLVSRLRISDPTLNTLSTSASTFRTVKSAGIMEPTVDQMNAAVLYSMILVNEEDQATATEIEYLSERLSELELLLPELRKRRTIDHRVIDMLLSSQTQPLREGEL